MAEVHENSSAYRHAGELTATVFVVGGDKISILHSPLNRQAGDPLQLRAGYDMYVPKPVEIAEMTLATRKN